MKNIRFPAEKVLTVHLHCSIVGTKFLLKTEY